MSKQIQFPKSELAVALTAALAAGSVGNVLANDFNALTDVTTVQVAQWAVVSDPAAGTSTPSSTPTPVNDALYGVIVYQNTPAPNLATTYEVRTQVNETLTVNSSGYVEATNAGNLTLAGSGQSTSTRSYYQAGKIVINDGLNSAESIVNGTVSNYTAPADYDFTEGLPNFSAPTSTYTGGGNLTMDGRATIKNGLLVSTRSGLASGAENSGAGRLLIDAANAQIGVVNGSGSLNGLTANTSGTSILGGTSNAQAQVYLSGPNASLTNSNGKGVVVTSTATTLSGGSSSTYLHMTNNEAKFSNSSNDSLLPSSTNAIRVTGVKAGTDPYDAVNFAQFSGLQSDFNSAYSSLKRDIKDVESKAYGGIASAVALAGIPAPAAGKTYTIGAGWGNYEGENAFALGGRAQVTPEFQLTAGWGYSNEGNAFNVGAGYSW